MAKRRSASHPIHRSKCLQSSSQAANTRSHSVPYTRSPRSSSSQPSKDKRQVPTRSLRSASSSSQPSKKRQAPSPAETPTKPKAPPVASLFQARQTPSRTQLPAANPAWGRIPIPGPDGPVPRTDQPSARGSNGQTIPALWEDRKHRFRLGSRFVKTFSKREPDSEDKEDEMGPDLDQESNLQLQLIDMRPASRKDATARRAPVFYEWDKGVPTDWNNKQAIKALNDRRQQAIDRITRDRAWAAAEQQVLTDIFTEFPDISILEATERFNWHATDEGRRRDEEDAPTRTVESVRFEYLSNQEFYDAGGVPKAKKKAGRKRKAEDAAEDGESSNKAKKELVKKTEGNKRKADEMEDEKRDKKDEPTKTTKRKVDGTAPNKTETKPAQSSNPAKKPAGKKGRKSTTAAPHQQPLNYLNSKTLAHPERYQSGDLVDSLGSLLQESIGVGSKMLKLASLLTAIDGDEERARRRTRSQTASSHKSKQEEEANGEVEIYEPAATHRDIDERYSEDESE